VVIFLHKMVRKDIKNEMCMFETREKWSVIVKKTHRNVKDKVFTCGKKHIDFIEMKD
jgi:hypothetical protein